MGDGTKDIAGELRKDSASHFDIKATTKADYDTEGSDTFMLYLTKMQSAVTNETEFLFNPSRMFDLDVVNNIAILASNPEDGDGKSNGFVVLSVNMQSGDARGLHRDDNGTIRQLLSPEMDADESKEQRHLPLHARMMTRSAERKFTCGATHTHHTTMKLSEDDDRHTHKEGNMFSQGRSNLRTSTTKAASSVGDDNSRFIIRLVIAVDTEFIKNHRGVTPAIEYITWLVGAVNAILESDVGARLKVVKIFETDVFDSATTLDDGLDAMKEHFDGMVGAGSHLVHALLGRHIGGGIAYVGEKVLMYWHLHQFQCIR